MAYGIDIALSQNEFGIWDISLDENGDLKGTNSFDTAILMTLYCERRADESEIADVSQRRGWWGNILSKISGFEIGSKLWLLNQARNTQDNLNYGITYLQTAFNWFVTSGYAKKIQVTGKISNDTGMSFNIKIFTGNDNTASPLYALWKSTGVDVDTINIEVL